MRDDKDDGDDNVLRYLSELKAGVWDLCCGLQGDITRGQSVMPVDKDTNHCKQ